MLKGAIAIAGKDLRLIVGGGSGLIQAILLGLLLIFLFSLATPTGRVVDPQGAAAVFWLASIFGLVLIFNGLYGLEEHDDTRLGLILSPIPLQSVWLGKVLAGLVLLILSQIVFLPAVIVFLSQTVTGSVPMALLILLLVDWGLVILGGLLGALSQGQDSRDSFLSVILFPLLIPVLLGGIRSGAVFFSSTSGSPESWLTVLLAFDALFSGAALLLFPHAYKG